MCTLENFEWKDSYQVYQDIQCRVFKKGKIISSTFREASIKKTIFQTVKFKEVDFLKAKFKDVLFKNCAFESTDFSGAQGNIMFENCQWDTLKAYNLRKIKMLKIEHCKGNIMLNGSSILQLQITNHEQGKLYLSSLLARIVTISGNIESLGLGFSKIQELYLNAPGLKAKSFYQASIEKKYINEY